MPPAVHVRTDTIPLDQLQPFPGNAKRGNVPAILASLRKNGQYRGLVVRQQPDGAFVVLAGNHTRQALADHGPGDCGAPGCGACHNNPDWVPAARCDIVECDDDTALRVNLADNRTSDLGSYDYADLSELLGSLSDVAGTGYSDQDVQDIADLMALPDEEPKGEDGGKRTTPDGSDHDDLDTGNPDVFNPVINLRVPHAVFDRWRNALDAHPGDDDTAKLLGLLDEVEAGRTGAPA